MECSNPSYGACQLAAIIDELADLQGKAREALNELVDRGGLDPQDRGGFLHSSGERTGLTGEENHLTEKISFGEVGDGILRDLHHHRMLPKTRHRSL